jgi:hypothetical protein
MLATRQGGEVLTLAMNAITPKGTTMGARIEQSLRTRFGWVRRRYGDGSPIHSDPCAAGFRMR